MRSLQEQLNELWLKYQAKKTQKREQNLASLFQLNSPVLLNRSASSTLSPHSVEIEVRETGICAFPALFAQRLK